MTSFDAYMSYGTFVEMIHEICIPVYVLKSGGR
jgi:hypothetical protein